MRLSSLCGGMVSCIIALPVIAQDPWPVPRHANFALMPEASEVEVSLFVGGGRSRLMGSIQLFLGDPTVPSPMGPLAGWEGVSVDHLDLLAPDPLPLQNTKEPVRFILDPATRSTGLWNSNSYDFTLSLYLTTTRGGLPVPMPVTLRGFLATYTDAHVTPFLHVAGDNGNVADGLLAMTILATETLPPPPGLELWFSTEVGFDSGTPGGTDKPTLHVSPGDLLSTTGRIVRRNHDLTGRLGIMPIVPDLGLDAATVGPQGRVWFSFEESTPQIWSESLSRWLRHGDLLSEDGVVVATNEQLLARFVRMPPVDDAGLDAVAIAPNRAILFSTEKDFFSERLGVKVGHGDLLSTRGRIVARNAQLMAHFHPIQNAPNAVITDYGLDAVILRGNAEIWFSTEIGFLDAHLGWIGDGDLLSTTGRVVARNLKLLSAFAPIQDLADFGLDACLVGRAAAPGDFDLDGDVDRDDVSRMDADRSGPAMNAVGGDDCDLDDDGDVDQADFGLLQRCLSRSSVPADPDCAE